MSTYKNIREVYESAADCADTIRNEMKHYPDNDVDELVWQEADRQCIYTQDNWDVCNIMRCSDEMYGAEVLAPISQYESLDDYMTALAYHIWDQLIREALDKENV